jgi:hypothetical protein
LRTNRGRFREWIAVRYAALLDRIFVVLGSGLAVGQTPAKTGIRSRPQQGIFRRIFGFFHRVVLAAPSRNTTPRLQQ